MAQPPSRSQTNVAIQYFNFSVRQSAGYPVKGDAITPRELAAQLARTRREFLRTAAGLTLGGTLLGSSRLLRAATGPKRKKVVVITFGGGARDQETFAPEGQENIPHLMRELIPQSSFFSQVVNRGNSGPLRSHREPGYRSVRNHQQLCLAAPRTPDSV